MNTQIDKKQCLNDLIKFLSIEGITGEEKNIANAVEEDLVNSGIPRE